MCVCVCVFSYVYIAQSSFALFFYARGQSVVYTGDFNATADAHLGAAAIPRLRPNLLITESTYGSSVRETKTITT